MMPLLARLRCKLRRPTTEPISRGHLLSRAGGGCGAAFALIAWFASALAATAAPASTIHPFLPDLFDPRHRVLAPDLGSVKAIRFLTTDDYPPFHFALADGSLAGFDIDLARAICTDLKIACTIQARRFDTLIPQIKDGKDDAIIAAIADTAATRAALTFTAPYYTTPARFAALKTQAAGPATPEAFAGHTIGVEKGTAYEAYLSTFFRRATIKPFPTAAALRQALRAKTVDAIFGDAIGLAVWLNGTEAQGCCAFLGGPFTESHFFGDGVSIAVAKDNIVLRQALDFELAKLARDGTYDDLYLKYFPIGFY